MLPSIYLSFCILLKERVQVFKYLLNKWWAPRYLKDHAENLILREALAAQFHNNLLWLTRVKISLNSSSNELQSLSEPPVKYKVCKWHYIVCKWQVLHFTFTCTFNSHVIIMKKVLVLSPLFAQMEKPEWKWSCWRSWRKYVLEIKPEHPGKSDW